MIMITTFVNVIYDGIGHAIHPRSSVRRAPVIR
jgi:hypothetical protein